MGISEAVAGAEIQPNILQRLAGAPQFPEGPRWHDGALWYSDLLRSTVSRIVPGEEPQDLLELDDRPSGLGFMPDGSLLVVAMHRRQLLRWAKGSLSLHADLSALPGEFLNDMVVDGEGRAYVDSRSSAVSAAVFHRDAGGPDCLLVVEPDGSCRVGAEALCSPNGIAISPDGRTLTVAETYAQRVAQFDRDKSGRLSRYRVLVQFERVFPDGIALDARGGIWIGSPYSDEVVEVKPDGTVGRRIALPGAVACAFGGDERGVLFVPAVDRRILPPADGAAAGSGAMADSGAGIYAFDVGVAGAGWP